MGSIPMENIGRRTVIGEIATLTIGSAALATQPETTVALEDPDFSVPDEDKQIVDPVSSVVLDCTVDYAWEATNTPSECVLRLSMAYQNATSQLDAVELPSPLNQDDSGSHTFNCNLLDHPNFESVELNPESINQSKSITPKFIVELTLRRNGHELGSAKASDTAELTATKTAGSADVSLGGSGEVQINPDA